MDRYMALGTAIANSILDCGSDGRAHRIALKGGTWPDNETDLGGLCEEALAAHIRDVLIDRDVFGEFRHLYAESNAHVSANPGESREESRRGKDEPSGIRSAGPADTAEQVAEASRAQISEDAADPVTAAERALEKRGIAT